MFWLVITASGVLGLAISFTSMWFLRQTSATTYRYEMNPTDFVKWMHFTLRELPTPILLLLQPCRVSQQDPPLHGRNPSLQSPHKHGELHKHTVW
jgi:hypothetical protein